MSALLAFALELAPAFRQRLLDARQCLPKVRAVELCGDLAPDAVGNVLGLDLGDALADRLGAVQATQLDRLVHQA